MDFQSSKEHARRALKQLRSEISPQRRKEATDALFKTLSKLLLPFSRILSFANFGSEIDLSRLNSFLEKNRCLILPPKEPSVGIDAQIALVPGLGFDHMNYRIGYGRGYYDQLLARMPRCHTIGIGFKEQLILSLPREPHDLALQEILLF